MTEVSAPTAGSCVAPRTAFCSSPPKSGRIRFVPRCHLADMKRTRETSDAADLSPGSAYAGDVQPTDSCLFAACLQHMQVMFNQLTVSLHPNKYWLRRLMSVMIHVNCLPVVLNLNRIERMADQSRDASA